MRSQSKSQEAVKRILLGSVLLAFAGVLTQEAQAGVLAAGEGHACATIDGGVQCWGSNNVGQLGNGTTEASLLPAFVIGLGSHSGATGVAAGYGHSCAIAEGGLKCWGDNTTSQLGTGDQVPSTTPVQAIGLNSGVTAVAAGTSHTCAVVDGGVQCWGDSGGGKLGTPAGSDSSRPVSVVGLGPNSGASAVAVGTSHTCAIVNGSVLCWGWNGDGQLGNGNNDPSTTPIAVLGPLDGHVVALAAAYHHTCAALDSGQMYCWGWNSYGQLGDGTSNNSSSIPRLVASLPSGVSSIAAGGSYDGFTAVSHTCAAAGTDVRCWGANPFGQLGNGTTQDSANPVSVIGPTDTISVAAGGMFSCAMDHAQRVSCWGYDRSGALGDGGFPAHVLRPTVSPALSGIGGVAAGALHACGIKDGSAWCWGANGYGQLGNGTTTDAGFPVEVAFGISGAVERISGGAVHSCGVVSGNAYCWGRNDSGQLGDNSSEFSSAIPVSVSGLGSDTTAVIAGDSYSCALGDDSQVRCWGRGELGQLGDGDFIDSWTPVSVNMLVGQTPVTLTGATTISGGDTHACAVVGGGAWCWGANDSGQLGNGTVDASSVAVQVIGLSSSVDSVVAGGSHSCAITNSGGVKCWGSNFFGQLGDGSTDDSLTPVPVLISASTPLTGAVHVAVGYRHSCAVIDDGSVACWGNNYAGQVGNGLTTDVEYATTVLPSSSGATGVATGANFTCAWSSVTTWCWGNSSSGSLGSGLGYSTTPVVVRFDRIFGNSFEVVSAPSAMRDDESESTATPSTRIGYEADMPHTVHQPQR